MLNLWVVYVGGPENADGNKMWAAHILDRDTREVVGFVEPGEIDSVKERVQRLVSLTEMYEAMPSLLGGLTLDEEKE